MEISYPSNTLGFMPSMGVMCDLSRSSASVGYSAGGSCMCTFGHVIRWKIDWVFACLLLAVTYGSRRACKTDQLRVLWLIYPSGPLRSVSASFPPTPSFCNYWLELGHTAGMSMSTWFVYMQHANKHHLSNTISVLQGKHVMCWKRWL